MQLGASKAPASVAAASLAAQLEEEAAAEEGVDGNPWGTDDLIDINADEDDWSEWVFVALDFDCLIRRLLLVVGAFENAPILPAVVEPKPVSVVGLGLNNAQLQNGISSMAGQCMTVFCLVYVQTLISFSCSRRPMGWNGLREQRRARL